MLGKKAYIPLITVLVLLLSIQEESKGQYMTSPNLKDIFPKGRTYKLSYWQGDVGGAYVFPTTGEQTETLVDNIDTTYQVTYMPNGGFGYYASLGRYHFTPDLKFFKYIDYSIGYRSISGGEEYKTELSTRWSDQVLNGGGEGTFKEEYILVNFNLNNVIQVGDFTFLQNSLGLNGEYRLSKGKVSYSGSSYLLDPVQPPSLHAQLHYKLGFGFKLNKKLFIIPALETAILNAYPFDARSTIPIFNSRYRPVTLSIRVLLTKRYRPSGY